MQTDMAPRNRIVFSAIVLTGLLVGTPAIVLLGPQYRQWQLDRNIYLEPQLATVAGEVFEYQRVKVPLKLYNASRSQLIVDEIYGSCGCMAFATTDGKELALPLRLASEESIPIEVTIGTGSRSGPQEFKVWVRCGSGYGAAIDKMSAIKVVIRAGQRALPDTARFEQVSPGDEVTKEMYIYDGFPDPGIPIKSVSVSHPDKLSAEMSFISSSSSDLPKLGVGGLAPRCRIAIRLHPPRDEALVDFTGSVIVVPDSTTCPSIQIPIIVISKKRFIEFKPDNLTVRKADLEGKVTRLIRCITRDSAVQLRVASCPEFISAQLISSENDDRYVKIEVDGPALKAAGKAEIHVAGDDERGTPTTVLHILVIDD